jgi:hypothetical protein
LMRIGAPPKRHHRPTAIHHPPSSKIKNFTMNPATQNPRALMKMGAPPKRHHRPSNGHHPPARGQGRRATRSAALLSPDSCLLPVSRLHGTCDHKVASSILVVNGTSSAEPVPGCI